ncbi:hypothetical protein LG3211_3439 [Lysobacter gummosus]|nr:hypothetical protein LG3211_3439 [Lysobacter gummosus]
MAENRLQGEHAGEPLGQGRCRPATADSGFGTAAPDRWWAPRCAGAGFAGAIMTV